MMGLEQRCEEFHQYSRRVLEAVENRLSERLLGPKFAQLAQGEIIPMRRENYTSRGEGLVLIDLAYASEGCIQFFNFD